MSEFSTQQRHYDELCGVAYMRLLAQCYNKEVIAISPFDPSNKEHLWLLGVAKGLGSVIQKDVCVDTSRFQVWKLNRHIDKECRYRKLKRGRADVITPDSILEPMREHAAELCGDDFNFGQIYDAFYARKD